MDQTTDAVTQGTISMVDTPDIAGHGNNNGNGVNQQTTGVETSISQQVPPSREAFFQSNWDKHSSFWKEKGFDVKPDSDPFKVYEPFIKAYEIVTEMSNNPISLLETAAKFFPERVSRPNYNDEIKKVLDQEFGENFVPDSREALQLGSQSNQYLQRMNNLSVQFALAEQQKVQQHQQKEIQRQQMVENDYTNGIKEVSVKMGVPEDQVRSTMEILKNPDVWKYEHLYTLALLASGKARFDMPKNPINLNTNMNNNNNPPPSPLNFSGGIGNNVPKTIGDWVGL